MNTQLTQDRRQLTASESIASPVIHRSRPPNLLERMALRLGMALIIWGRGRSRVLPDRAEQARRYRARVDRERREREYELAAWRANVRR